MNNINNEEKMHDVLSYLYHKQVEFQEKLLGIKGLPQDRQSDFQYQINALICEIGEVLYADKRWKNNRDYNKYNREEKLEELVDVLHFLINMVIFSGFTYGEFIVAILRKNYKNFKRLEEERNG